MQNEKSIDELGLSTSIVCVLKGKGVQDYAELCEVLPGSLRKWGLDTDQIGEVVTLVKDG